MPEPVRIAITGAAGQIGYQLCFRIAAGDMLGPDQLVELRLIEIPPAMDALRGVTMELADCAFPLLHDVVATSDLNEGFDGVGLCILVGAKPRGEGMERSDLLAENGKIFGPQGEAIGAAASGEAKVLVVGNPANTNCLIAASNAAGLEARQFHAMARLDHNRAKAQLATRSGAHVSLIRRMTIWGNHSSTQFPDLEHATVDGRPAPELVTERWVREEFIPTVQKRGAAIIEARGASSAASAASAAIDHMRSWVLGTHQGDWVSMAVPADGSYGIEPGVVFSFPCTCRDGEYEIVDDLELDEFARERLEITDQELREERGAIQDLLGT